MKRIYLVLLVLLALSACKKDNPGLKAGKDLTLNATQLQQASADNTFTFNLFKTVNAGNTTGQNLFISPLSVSMALGMTANGASGQTLKAIDSAMSFNGFTQDQVNAYFNSLLVQLPELDPNTTVKIANSIWYSDKFSVLPDFLQTNSKYFQAKAQSLDFSSSGATGTINNWVSDATSGKITKLLDQVQPNDVMYLINAIYFKSTWANKFDASQTLKMNFYLSGNNAVQADFMNGRINFNATGDENAYVIELPYSNNKYSMVIAEPASGKTVNDLVAALDNTTWQKWMSDLHPNNQPLSMPKFQFSYGTDLNNALTSSGMGIAFTPQADFTRINQAGGLDISKVLHKACIAVDENGTTAAAATLVGIQVTDAAPVILNRPFIFVIREMKTGLILFAGIMNDPTQSGS
ncbi:MAG TPA: serpin family protein [Mucilaginibacter sp.]|nr:serpin family protein [Mucilaginibacter sp.]